MPFLAIGGLCDREQTGIFYEVAKPKIIYQSTVLIAATMAKIPRSPVLRWHNGLLFTTRTTALTTVISEESYNYDWKPLQKTRDFLRGSRSLSSGPINMTPLSPR